MSKRVVIAGMGDTGLLTATLLSRRFDVTGIGTTPMFVSGQELGARLARPEVWRRDYLMEYARYRRLAGVELLHGAVRSVDLDRSQARIDLADGGSRDVLYDALVIATGTTNGFWRSAAVLDRDQVEAGLAEAAATVRASRTVAVVGGGPSGVSAASQIADAVEGAHVTVYHSGDGPLPGYHPRTRRAVARYLRRQGVAIASGHRAVVPSGASATLGGGTIRWATGQSATEADLIVWAVGDVRPNTDFLPPAILDDDGFVRVEPTFRLPGHENVFAVGDVAATDPLRSSARNFGYRILAKNVATALEGRAHRMRPFRPPSHRWGSITGLQRAGIRIYTPTGHHVPLRPAFARHVLYPWLTHRLLYGGLHRPVDEDEDGSIADSPRRRR